MLAGLGLLAVLAVAPQDAPPIPGPQDLPRAESGRWEGLFEGREVVASKLPQAIGPLVLEARELYFERDYPAAIAVMLEALRREPDFPPTLLELGTAYFRLRRYGDAALCLERFLELAPAQVFRTQALGHCYYSLGRHERARDHYRAVLAELPDSVEAMRGLALSQYRLGWPDEALAGLERVIALEPEHAEAWTFEAQILWEEGRSEDALLAAERARDLDRFSPKPWFLLSRVLADLGRDDESEQARRHWQRLDRLTQEARALEARLLYRPDDYELALALVRVQREIGDARAARSALARVVRSRPDHVPEVDVRIHALDVLVALGDDAGAALAAEELARACPDEARAWERLRNYFGRIGDAERQLLAGERYLRLEAE